MTSYYPISVVDKLAILAPSCAVQGYYRSKLFTAPSSVNALSAAAGPLLSLLERLCLSSALPPIEHIRDNIEHELKAFHSKLDASKYPADLIHIARYLLSATIDELLGKNYLRIYSTIDEFNAFTPLTSDGALPEARFFEILHYVFERPNQYLDLIELTYFCLTLGFEGQYHLKADGRQALDNYIEDLYQIIQTHRFNKSHRLFNDNPLPKTVKTSYKSSFIATGIAFGVLVFSFLSSHFILENKAKTVLSAYSRAVIVDH